MDAKKNEIIERLEMRIKQLESQKKNAYVARKKGRESPMLAIQPIGLMSRDSLSNSKKSLPLIGRPGQNSNVDQS